MLNKDFLSAFKNDERFHPSIIEEKDVNDIHLSVNVKKVFRIIVSGYTAKKPVPKLLATLYLFNDNTMSIQVGSLLFPITMYGLADMFEEKELDDIKKYFY